MTGLPIDPLLPRLLADLQEHHRMILTAPPGSGKTTAVPLALLDCDWRGDRRILLIEPRRLATRAAAQRMAYLLGQEPGQTVGYRMRMERRISHATRIEVLTEGLFTRRLQHDPELADTAAVLFDEYHQRSLDADLGLALTLDIQDSIRPDLRVLLMSATLDDERLRGLLDAPVLSAESRAYPVSVEYAGPSAQESLTNSVTRAVRRAAADCEGHILVFLPGMREIRQVQQQLALAGLAQIDVLPLHGSLPAAEQLRALQPATMRRRIVLASAVAETSLTIEGVGVVIDAGLERRPRFDLARGVTRLETIRASTASAEQRRGRAGRTGPGHCIRLWHESTQATRPAHAQAEILLADLLPLALELAAWGVSDPSRLVWLDPPPQPAWQQALSELRTLGAIDANDKLTAHGRAMADTGLHPRLAHMLLHSRTGAFGYTACWVAALLQEDEALRPDRRQSGAVDLGARLEQLSVAGGSPLQRRMRHTAEQLARRLDIASAAVDASQCGVMIALAYPERLAQMRPGERHRYRLRNGRGAVLRAADELCGEDFLAIAELDGSGADSQIRAAASLTRADVETHFAASIQSRRPLHWDRANGVVVAREQLRLGELVIDDRPDFDADPAAVAACLLDGVRQAGLDCLPWNDRLRQWQARVGFLRASGLCEPLPAECSDAALLTDLENWLAPFLHKFSRLDRLQRVDLTAALHARLNWNQQQAMDKLLPETIEVPSGSRVRVDYCQGGQPVLAVRLQEMFGLRETPQLARGRVQLLLHLLSPARRPVQVTADLGSFWTSGYAAVRKELRGRYPKHAWPEDPGSAQALRGVRRRPA